MMRRAQWAVVASVVTILAAGCGGDASSTGTASTSGIAGTSSPSGAPARAATTLTAADFSFTPTSLTVAPGATVTLTVQNTGAQKHNFTQQDLKLNKDLDPGTTSTITFTAPQSGTLSFHCEYHPTKMTGTIVVGATH